MSANFWLPVFAYSVYIIAIIALWVTYRKDGLFYASLPVVFTIYFLISELAATQGGLPYEYGTLLPHHVCIDPGILTGMMNYLYGEPGCPGVPACVPIAVPIMESLLVFGVLLTGMLLRPPGWLLPFMVAFVCTAVDWILDPTSAISVWCGSGTYTGIEARGLPFWTWHVWGHYQPNWHGIPLVNFGAWYFGTFGIVAASRQVVWVRKWFGPSRRSDILSILGTLGIVLLLGLIFEVLAFVSMAWIFQYSGASGQWAFLIFLGVSSVVLTLVFAKGFQRAQPSSCLVTGLVLRTSRTARFTWEWLPIPALLMVSSLVGLIFAGPHELLGLLCLAWVVISLVVTAYMLWPFSRP